MEGGSAVLELLLREGRGRESEEKRVIGVCTQRSFSISSVETLGSSKPNTAITLCCETPTTLSCVLDISIWTQPAHLLNERLSIRYSILPMEYPNLQANGMTNQIMAWATGPIKYWCCICSCSQSRLCRRIYYGELKAAHRRL